MRKLFAALLFFLALATAAQAAPVNNKVVVLYSGFADDRATSFGRLVDRQAHGIRALRESGINFDVIAAQDTAAYFARAEDDSTALRKRYDAVMIFAVPALSNTATDGSNKIHLGFRPAGTTTLNNVGTNSPHSPFSGRWKINVFAWQFDVVNNSNVSFVNGCSLTAGNANISSQMQKTTAACPVNGLGSGDTMFVDSRNVLRDMDTAGITVLMAGVNSWTHKKSAVADSITYWFYDPDGDGIGVYWLNVREYNPNGSNNPTVWSYGDAMMIGQMCQVTGIVPTKPMLAWFDMDHVYPHNGTAGGNGRAESFNVRDMNALADSLSGWKWWLSGPIQCGTQVSNASLVSDLGGQGFIQDGVRQVVKDRESMFSFHVHDHFDVNTSTWRSSAQDTAAVCRTNFNLALANGNSSSFRSLSKLKAAGSFGFYTTLPQDDGDWRALKVFGDAGSRMVRGIGGMHIAIPAADTKAGRLSVDPFTFPMPYRAPGADSKIVWVCGGNTTIASGARTIATFTAGNYSASVVGWMNNAFPMWLIRGSSYWHGNENMQGVSTEPSSFAPPILYMKHMRNMLKLTAPFVQPTTEMNSFMRGASTVGRY